MRPTTLAEAIADKYEIAPSGCWEWTRYIRPAGYGMVGIPGQYRTIDAHRASWMVHRGPIPDGLFVCHTCDNRKCINPDHLWLGTHQDNIDDMVRKGRSPRSCGEASGMAKLTTEQVAEIRRRYVKGIHPARRTGGSPTELAAEFGITKQYVWQLAAGKWRVTS